MAEPPLDAPRAAPGWGGRRVLSVGHSTGPLGEFLALLRAAGAVAVADVRTVPRSRRCPWADAATLPDALAEAGLRYQHLPALGGLRRPRPGSPNGALRRETLRGFADHMATAEFEEGLVALRRLAREGPVALLCAEAAPGRCHRWLIADALWARGVVVEHLVAGGRARRHAPTPLAAFEGRSVTYPPEATARRS